MRIALMVEYDGSAYYGWQTQTNLRTIQQVTENALSFVADEEVRIFCAGRTDTGVHATHQIIHFDTEKHRSIQSWIHGANANLPKDICIRWAREVPQDFHARFSATSRRYTYVIHNVPVRPAVMRGQVTWQYRQLDEQLMNEAAALLHGENDFTSFRSVECQSKTPVRNITELKVTRKGDWVIIDVEANAFLHHMVRNIAGVLMAVGNRRHPVAWVDEVLAAKDRRMGAETASPYGLYLVGVSYPEEYGIISGGKPPLMFW